MRKTLLLLLFVHSGQLTAQQFPSRDTIRSNHIRSITYCKHAPGTVELWNVITFDTAGRETSSLKIRRYSDSEWITQDTIVYYSDYRITRIYKSEPTWHYDSVVNSAEISGTDTIRKVATFKRGAIENCTTTIGIPIRYKSIEERINGKVFIDEWKYMYVYDSCRRLIKWESAHTSNRSWMKGRTLIDFDNIEYGDNIVHSFPQCVGYTGLGTETYALRDGSRDSVVFHTGTGIIDGNYVHEYDSNGRCVYVTVYNGGGWRSKVLYTAHVQFTGGSTVHTYRNALGSVTSTLHFWYDERGLQLRHLTTFYEIPIRMEEFTYEYTFYE